MRIIKSSMIIALCVGAICLICLFASAAGSASVSGGYITGYVLDEDGKPVPKANVTLWQDGRLWHSNASNVFMTGDNQVYVTSDNPQISRPTYSNETGFLREGGFLFGFTYPGDYTLTAEKDGYNGTVSVTINEGTIMPVVTNLMAVPVNITLKGYHAPAVPPGQPEYTGAITGNIRTGTGIKTTGLNVSLWKDGHIVDKPDNPQVSFPRKYSGVEVDYLFEHLEPGCYTVIAEYYAPNLYNETVPVSVSTRPMRADIVLSRFLTSPTDFPVDSFSPTVGEFSPSAGSKPTPAIPWVIVLITFGTLAYFIQKKM